MPDTMKFMLYQEVFSTTLLRLDNTGAWVVEVNPSLLCNRMTENVEYIPNESLECSLSYDDSHHIVK